MTSFKTTTMPITPRRTTTKEDGTLQNRTDPPGTPPISSSMCVDERSDRSMTAVRPFNGGATPKKIPPAFNRTIPTPVTPRVLFSDENNRERRHKSPPSVKRKGQEKPVFLWELEDEDDIPALSDSSGEHESPLAISDMAVLSGNVYTPQRKGPPLFYTERGGDVASDPGYSKSRVKTNPNSATKQEASSSDVAGPTSFSSPNNRWQNGTHFSPSKRGTNTTNEQPSGDIPQSPDEHTARLKEIMNKREKKKKRKKTKKRCDTEDSDVSGASSNTRTSSSVTKYADDPNQYLTNLLQQNEILTNSEKKRSSFRSDDAASAVSSKDSKGSTVSSLGSKSSSIASHGKWRDAKIEKKYPTVIDADKGSDASSDVSGASNTSSIFAATRAKLKGYLKTYKKSDKKKLQKDSNKSTKPAASQLSPARELPPGNEITQGTPGTLFSIEESDSDSPLRKVHSNSPRTPASRNRRNFEEKITYLSTPPSSSTSKISLPHIHEAVESDTTTKVMDLPWRYDGKNMVSDDKSITELKHVGLYSGPVNEVLQPHGKGKIVLKANSSEIFYGTWEDGKLVSPLTDEKEPVTDDEDEIDESLPNASRGRIKEEPTQTENSAALTNRTPQTASVKYAVNRHHIQKRISMDAAIERESAALAKVRDKKRRQPKPKPKPLVRYNIGDACRTPQDMIICSSKHAATESAGLLKKWGGAFIKRSSGVWTYAILIERALQPIDVIKRRLEYFYWTTVWEVDPRYEMEDSMLFAIDGDGGTKIIPRHAWAKYIRRIQRNTIPDIPRRISNPLPTEIAIESSGQDGGKAVSLDDDSLRGSDEEAQIVVYPC